MYRHFARLAGIEKYDHLKFRVRQDNAKNLEIAIRSIAALGITGANITIPYKLSVMRYLDDVDKTARAIGAVNTIVNKDGRLIGYNTDGYGAMEVIKTRLRPLEKTDLIAVFGAGGAARAIVGSLPKVSRVVLLVRLSSLGRAKKLQRDFRGRGFEIEVRPLTDQHIVSALTKADLVINATSVGMYPKCDASLVHRTHLSKVEKSTVKNKMFFDAVYNPFQTALLRLAGHSGAKTCPGIYMTVYQGVKAFELWTGKKVSAGAAERTAQLLLRTIREVHKK